MTYSGVEVVEWNCTHCDPIKSSTFYFMNNSVKNPVILILFGTQNAEEILRKCHVACPPQLKDVATMYLVKGRSYASDQISVDLFRNWMRLE